MERTQEQWEARLRPTERPQVERWRPTLFRPSQAADLAQMDALLDEKTDVIRRDTIQSQLAELLKGRAPGRKWTPAATQEAILGHLGDAPAWAYGVWAWYPWLNELVHILDEAEFIEVRTHRNRYHISPDEQARLGALTVGVVGLSVGQSAAVALAMERGCGRLRLADFDALELTNLNRLRAGVHHLGLSKVTLAAREIAALDPYLQIECFHEGLTADNMDRFFLEGGPLDLLVEECDSFDIKVLARKRARALQIPVVMDTSDRGMLDIERFDLDPHRPLFHGLAPALERRDDLSGLTMEEKVPLVLSILGTDAMSPRARASLLEIDQSVSSWPQLASAVSLGGALVAEACRHIALGRLPRSGRFYVDVEELLGVEPSLPRPPAAPAAPAPLTRDALLSMRAALAPAQPDAPPLPREHARALVEAAVRAPSGGNMQPWRWLSGPDGLYGFVEPARAHSLLDWDCRAAALSLGAAAQNIALTAWRRGLDLTITPTTPAAGPSPLAVRFALGAHGELSRPEPRQQEALVDWIGVRETNRKLGPRQALPAGALARLMDAARGPGIGAAAWERPDTLDALGEVLGEAEQLRTQHPWGHADFVRELRWSPEENLATRDGIDQETLELTPARRAALGLLRDGAVIHALRGWGRGRGLGKLMRDGLAAASAVVALTGPMGSALDAFAMGRAVQRCWLEAARLGVAAQPIGPLLFLLLRLRDGGAALDPQDIETLNDLNARLTKTLGLPAGQPPAFLLRLSMARAPEVKSLRRPVEEVWEHV